MAAPHKLQGEERAKALKELHGWTEVRACPRTLSRSLGRRARRHLPLIHLPRLCHRTRRRAICAPSLPHP